MIQTVTGPIQLEQAGPVLIHEHVFCDFYRITEQLDQLLNDEALAVDELGSLFEAGGRTVVDCTPADLGRDPLRLRNVAVATGLQIVMGTGWYRRRFYPPEIDDTPTNELARRMVHELTVGVDETEIRAGVIGEIGVDGSSITAIEERVLRAAARAHRGTGAPILTHASMYPVGLGQLEILEDEGVAASRVVIGHADTYLDHAYHVAVLERGAYLAFDTIGRNHMNSDARRLDAVLTLLSEGWAEKILLSSDRCHRSDLRSFGGPGYAAVFRNFLPRLRAAGVADGVVNTLMLRNPARVLSWSLS